MASGLQPCFATINFLRYCWRFPTETVGQEERGQCHIQVPPQPRFLLSCSSDAEYLYQLWADLQGEGRAPPFLHLSENTQIGRTSNSTENVFLRGGMSSRSSDGPKQQPFKWSLEHVQQFCSGSLSAWQSPCLSWLPKVMRRPELGVGSVGN